MATRFVGVDPSFTRSGVCLIEDGRVELVSIKTSSKDDDFARQKKAAIEICKLLRPDDVVVIEDFGISARFAPSGRYVERIELCGMLKLLGQARTRVPWMTCPPNILKMFTAGKAGASKDDVLVAVRHVWGQDVDNNDEADAYGMARIGEAAVFGTDHPKRRVSVDKFIVHGVNAKVLRTVTFMGLDKL